jgi:hypothetical protein
MPVVGKRYRRKSLGCDYQVVVENILDGRHIVCAIVPDGKRKRNRFTYQPHYFWDDYEELPDSNSQKPKEVQINENTNQVDLEKEEVNEVERALEELKREINYLENEGIIDFEAYLKLRTRSQNLVDALGAEKTVMSKPEPKIDMKEEHVEPVSIWKDVSEEIDNQSIIFVNKAGYARLAEYWNDKVYFIEGDSGDVKAHYIDKNYYGKKYCTLTDFINSFESMQKDIEELKKGRK